jgi:membrane protein required for beta-lactamase induction
MMLEALTFVPLVLIALVIERLTAKMAAARRRREWLADARERAELAKDI